MIDKPFQHPENRCASAADWEELVRQVDADPASRKRLCLHADLDSPLHQMLNVFGCRTYLRPHRHPPRKVEAYHLLEGVMDVFLFTDDGAVGQILRLTAPASGGPFLLRLRGGCWHQPLPATRVVVFHEIFTGPFVKERDVEYAAWSPEGVSVGDPAVRAHLERLDAKRCEQFGGALLVVPGKSP